MNYTISNEKLTLVVSSKGGEFQSVKDAEGQEYLWQGDAATWTDRGPNLFPYIGRMTEKSYKYQDTVYHMDIHGFLPYDEMELVEQKADSLTLRLVSSPETRKQYPFEFTLDITWKLEGEKITITYQVKNTDDKKMYFGIGGHPGFQIPIEKNLKFEDYRITVTLETLQDMISLMEKNNMSILDIVQIAVTQIKKTGRYHMMSANNPVFIVEGRRMQ